MKYLQNLHTHSTYCDGKDTLEEMLLSAIEQGFDSVGFSGHSYMHYSPSHSMSIEGTEAYKKEVAFLKEKYKDKLDIFCGLEVDMYSEIDLSGYDYLLGAVHYLKKDGEYLGFDRGVPEVTALIDEHFGGDGMAFAKVFYETIPELPKYGKFDVLAHYDICAKLVEKKPFFDENDPKYQKMALEALDALTGKIPFFEVNTGAIARGYRTTPYPNLFLMKAFKELGWGPVIGSDCHDKRYLKHSFDEAEEILKSVGFREVYVLKSTGFEAIGLD